MRKALVRRLTGGQRLSNDICGYCLKPCDPRHPELLHVHDCKQQYHMMCMWVRREEESKPLYPMCSKCGDRVTKAEPNDKCPCCGKVMFETEDICTHYPNGDCNKTFHRHCLTENLVRTLTSGHPNAPTYPRCPHCDEAILEISFDNIVEDAATWVSCKPDPDKHNQLGWDYYRLIDRDYLNDNPQLRQILEQKIYDLPPWQYIWLHGHICPGQRVSTIEIVAKRYGWLPDLKKPAPTTLPMSVEPAHVGKQQLDNGDGHSPPRMPIKPIAVRTDCVAINNTPATIYIRPNWNHDLTKHDVVFRYYLINQETLSNYYPQETMLGLGIRPSHQMYLELCDIPYSGLRCGRWLNNFDFQINLRWDYDMDALNLSQFHFMSQMDDVDSPPTNEASPVVINDYRKPCVLWAADRARFELENWSVALNANSTPGTRGNIGRRNAVRRRGLSRSLSGRTLVGPSE